jgi:hypothetical protein
MFYYENRGSDYEQLGYLSIWFEQAARCVRPLTTEGSMQNINLS